MKKTVDDSDKYAELQFQNMTQMECILIDKLYELGLIPCKESTLALINLHQMAVEKGAREAVTRFYEWMANPIGNPPYGVKSER